MLVENSAMIARYEQELMPRANAIYQEDKALTRREKRRKEREIKQDLFKTAKEKGFAGPGITLFWLFLTNPELWKAIVNLVRIIMDTMNKSDPPLSLPGSG